MASTDLRLFLVLCAVGVSCSKLSKLEKEENSGRLRCAAEGRFAHPDNCDEYVDCIPGRQGNSLEARAASCKGGVFNSDVKKCLAPGKDTNCTTHDHDRHPRAVTLYPNFDDFCNGSQSGFFCLTCKTLVNCVNGRANVDDCSAGHTCDEKEIFGGGVCYPNSPAACSCNNQQGLRPDNYRTQAYLECETGSMDPKVRFCQKEMIFKPEKLMCDYHEDYIECTKRGNYPNPDDCTKYYKCMPVTQGLIQYALSCPCGSLFNELAGECQDPCSYQPVEFSCKAEGRFPDEYDCHKFYLCIADASSETGFRQYHRTCPHRSIWNAGIVVGTGSCQNTGTSDCLTRRVPKCGVPDGRDCSVNVTAEGTCAQGSPNCHCNSATGYASCMGEYVGDGVQCVESSDPVLCGENYCHNMAGCIDGACQCVDGYVGDGVTICDPIDTPTPIPAS